MALGNAFTFPRVQKWLGLGSGARAERDRCIGMSWDSIGTRLLGYVGTSTTKPQSREYHYIYRKLRTCMNRARGQVERSLPCSLLVFMTNKQPPGSTKPPIEAHCNSNSTMVK